MDVSREDLLTPPHSIGYQSRAFKNDKRLSRKVKPPKKTPVHSSDSVIVKFQLVNGTPTPSLEIRTTGSHKYLKARKRLFRHNDETWSKQLNECCNTLHTPIPVGVSATDSAAESCEEAETTTQNYDTKQKTIYRVKVCASCKTKKTPLWRDAEDGTPHCNACGIRFKKYRMYCPLCSYIPRKDEKFGKTCCQCGSTLFHYRKM